MNQSELLISWHKEEFQLFEGWDFSYLRGRMLEEKPPWSFADRAAKLLDTSSSVLDMDTGGGERLLALRPHWPCRVTATEGYPPNVDLARDRLTPVGVSVVDTASNPETRMPFPDESFDLVLNRHGGFNPPEIARVILQDGVFLTEQVHDLWAHDLKAAFEVPPPSPDNTLERMARLLETAGMRIERREDWIGRLSFTDVGAIVYYLKAIPWIVPHFSVDRHARYLFQLQQQLERDGHLTFTARTYLIEAVKRR